MYIDKYRDAIKQLGEDLGYEVSEKIDNGTETTSMITFEDNGQIYLTVILVYWGIDTKIKFYEINDNLIVENTINEVCTVPENMVNKVEEILKKNMVNLLNIPEKIYDYGEENNWQGLEQKHYEILSQDANLARMAVADMQDKEIVIPEILKKFRRYSMSFKDVVVSKIAKNKKEEQQINRVATVNKKAAEEDIKLKVQKNKPSGLDTSAPQVLEGKAKKVFEDMMTAYSNVQEVKADIEKFKAKTDKLIQKKIQKVGLDEKTAKLQELVNKSAKLVSSIENTTFQNADKLGVFVNKTQVVPKKFSDKEKIAKLMEYIDKELGKGRAEQYLKNAENGLQSQATEKAIKELVVFEPTKQQKTSDTHDEESNIDTLIDTMKEVYTNLRNYYLSMVKTNNVIEEQLLPTVGATASKKQVVTKKAKVNKKATVSLEMEIDDYIELLKNEYETSPEDWKTRGSRLLMNEFYEYMENFDGGKVKQPSEVMDNFLINGSFCERATDFTADGEWSNKFEEYNGNWEEFCENEAVIYNEDAACTKLGF